MNVEITEYPAHPPYGLWGWWKYDNEHGNFGCSNKGMWAELDGNIFSGLETYEMSVTESFKQSIKRWRDLNRAFKKTLGEIGG